MHNRNLLESFNCAFEGVIHAFRTQRNFRLHFLAAAIVIITSLWLRLSKVEVVLLFFAIVLVLATEMINTSIEAAIDLITREYHPLAAVAKNVAAGAVLATSVNALIVGYLIFYPRLDQNIPAVLRTVGMYPPYITLAIILSVVILVVALKSLTGKGRPLSGGMPSGHTAISFAVSTAILLFSHQTLLGFLAFISSFLVAQSRLEGEIHSLYEIVVGGILGVLVTVFFYQIFAL
jgi:diacylglycerol kinase (ATP)